MSFSGGTKSLSYQSIKTAAIAREAEKDRNETMHRSALVLIADYLKNKGYSDTFKNLKNETGQALDNFTVADNVNLMFILQEFEAFQHVKLGRAPKIIKRLTEEVKSKVEKGKHYASANRHRYADKPPESAGKERIRLTRNILNSNSSESSVHTHRSPSSLTNRNAGSGDPLPKIKKNTSSDATVLPTMEGSGISAKPLSLPHEVHNKQLHNTKPQIVDVKSLLHNAIQQATREYIPTEDCIAQNPEEKLLKPLGQFNEISAEYRSLAATISKEIYLENPNVNFKDIIGLDQAKKFVRESIVYPIKYPQLFQGSKLLAPWKGLLLYGPPGNGKTMLAKAVATECNTTFFNISASSIVSKWRGDSEKLVRVLFELARHHAPSTIFIDEIDSIMSTRDSSDHEGSKRMKTELLIQMDGLNASSNNKNSNGNVFVLAASNLPWSLDFAMLRRLEKRILVNLPSLEARQALFNHYLIEEESDQSVLKLDKNINFEKLSEMTENYSGADIYQICKESAMNSLRKIFSVLESDKGVEGLEGVEMEPVKMEDLERSIRGTRPATVSKIYAKYEKWAENFDTN